MKYVISRFNTPGKRQEFICEMMEVEHISIRALAKKAHVSPNTVQRIRSGNAININIGVWDKILAVFGSEVAVTTPSLKEIDIVSDDIFDKYDDVFRKLAE